MQERGKEQGGKRAEEIADNGETESPWGRRWNSKVVRKWKKGSEVKNPPANAGDTGLTPGRGSPTRHGAVSPCAPTVRPHSRTQEPSY